MKCEKCKCKAVILDPSLCKDHFIEGFDNKVEETINRFKLLNKSDKVLVATSGGKDSLTTLYLLKKFGFNPHGLLIDEGINNYRELTIKDMEDFGEKFDIPFIIKSFKEEYNYSLDDSVEKIDVKACHLCGILRRQLLNKYSKGYDVIATGHNLDDEAQSIMMNIFKAQTNLLARLGPITGIKVDNKFTKRIKPLYLIPEKHIKLYTILLNLKNSFTECPYTFDSFRNEIQTMLNNLESRSPGSKVNIVNHFLDNQHNIKVLHEKESTVEICTLCGEPSSNEVCNACKMISKLNNKIIN